MSPIRPPFATPNRKHRPASPSFVEPKPTRPSVQLRQTPSEVMAELEELPMEVFEEDYQPTPTLAEVQPTQLAPHLRSASDIIDLDLSQHTSQSSIDIKTNEAAMETDTETEMDEDKVQNENSNESLPPPRKHVAFQIDPSQSSTTLPSQDSSSTAVASTSESDRSTATTRLQLSQTSTDCEYSFSFALRIQVLIDPLYSRFDYWTSSHRCSPFSLISFRPLSQLFRFRFETSYRKLPRTDSSLLRSLARRLQRSVLLNCERRSC